MNSPSASWMRLFGNITGLMRENSSVGAWAKLP